MKNHWLTQNEKKNKPFTINHCFLEEAKRIEARWNQLGLFKNFNFKYTTYPAVLLEGQRLTNENGKK